MEVNGGGGAERRIVDMKWWRGTWMLRDNMDMKAGVGCTDFKGKNMDMKLWGRGRAWI